MYKIGTDIVLVSRVEKSIQSDTFINKVFTPREKEYCKRTESFAGIFAAKEAYFKAVGTGLRFPLTDVEVLHSQSGKPYFCGIKNCDLSISHDGDYAIATVVIYDEGK